MTPKMLLVLHPGTVPRLQGMLAKYLLEHKELIELKYTYT